MSAFRISPGRPTSRCSILMPRRGTKIVTLSCATRRSTRSSASFCSRWKPIFRLGKLSDCFEKADAVWTSSRFAADLLRPYFKGPIDVMPQVVPLPGTISSRSQQDELRRRLGISEGARVMLGASGEHSICDGGADDLARVFTELGLAARNWVLVLAPEWSSVIDDVQQPPVDPAIPGVIAVKRMTAQERSVLSDIAEVYVSSHCLPDFNPALARGHGPVETSSWPPIMAVRATISTVTLVSRCAARSACSTAETRSPRPALPPGASTRPILPNAWRRRLVFPPQNGRLSRCVPGRKQNSCCRRVPSPEGWKMASSACCRRHDR